MANSVVNINDGSPYEPPTRPPAPPLPPSDGGGISGDMEARVRALENRADRVDAKLDNVVSLLAQLQADLSFVRGKLDALPTSKDLTTLSDRLSAMNGDVSKISGRVDGLPTLGRLSALLALLAAFLAFLPKLQALLLPVHPPT